MGNRAVITTPENFDNGGIGIYVHWNGGRDSVEGYLRYCQMRSFRCPEKDCYGWARLCQVIANFVDQDGLSVGIDTVDRLDCDNFDNGVYLIKDWKIVGRKFYEGEEQNDHDLLEMIAALDRAQPVNQQLGEQMVRDLFREEKTISDVCSYEYMFKNNQMNGTMAKFEKGKEYKIEFTDIYAKVLDKKDMTIHICVENKDFSIPYFTWRNGCESATFTFKEKNVIMYSF